MIPNDEYRRYLSTRPVFYFVLRLQGATYIPDDFLGGPFSCVQMEWLGAGSDELVSSLAPPLGLLAGACGPLARGGHGRDQGRGIDGQVAVGSRSREAAAVPSRHAAWQTGVAKHLLGSDAPVECSVEWG